ncbi:outer membrane protein [Labilibaculum euxinus]|uniref:Outer membrane beta-barrel protein n=1 Tax=Labilibaculum euxinus TaxID=2686357 RepID=A0A7M4DBS1_9BACT|nr:outer membrane beta-barrel protein [Labilibaculum euxinus]MUP40100.1 outer membrane beta-barrel protein [Labilibaculum euxinus]MVB09305.1 outer membrane beta-barrel protein [Labilibaculum euxinus]
MKLFFTICAFFCCVVIVSAQTEQGKFFIGANSNINFSSMKTELKSDYSDSDGSTITTFEFAPQLGFFAGDGFLVGVELPYSTTKNKDTDYKVSQIGFGTFARYYFGTSNAKPYLHGGLGIGAATESNESDDVDYKLFTYEFGGGVAIFINKNIAVDLGLGYSSNTMKPKENNDADVKLVTSGVAFKVGFSLFL